MGNSPSNNNDDDDKQSLLANKEGDTGYNSLGNGISETGTKVHDENEEAVDSNGVDLEVGGDDHNDEDDDALLLVKSKEEKQLPIWTLICILSTAFAYGCIMTTLFIITLPVECQLIEESEENQSNIPKSVALGFFVSIAGLIMSNFHQ